MSFFIIFLLSAPLTHIHPSFLHNALSNPNTVHRPISTITRSSRFTSVIRSKGGAEDRSYHSSGDEDWGVVLRTELDDIYEGEY